MAVKLTDRLCKTIKPPAAGRLELTDDDAPGLAFRITASGEKSWAIRYTTKGGNQRRVTIGPYRDGKGVTLAAARARAHEIAAAARRGIDLPAVEAKAQEREVREAERPQTVRDLTRRYVTEYAEANQRRPKLTDRLFAMHVEPLIGKVALTELRRGDIVTLLDDLQNKKGLGAQVNRVRSQLAAALNWAVEREWLPANPAAGIKKKPVERQRERTLADDELRAIWRAADAIGYPGGTLAKLLILTGQRRDECRCLEWSEVREGGALWLLPGARNKSKRDHRLPLPEAVQTLLGTAPRHGSFVFSSDGKKPYNGTRSLKEALDSKSGVAGWVLHDIRRTVRTRLSEMGVPRAIASAILNHAKPGLDRVYDHANHRPAMLRALEAWAKRVDRIVAGKGDGKVVAIDRSRRRPSPA